MAFAGKTPEEIRKTFNIEVGTARLNCVRAELSVLSARVYELVISGSEASKLLSAPVWLQNDFTPEEEEEVRRENQWAFE